MDKNLLEVLDKELKRIGLEDSFKNIINEFKRLWMPFNKVFL